MPEEIVRVMRIIIYEGPRSKVEETIKRAVHGTKQSYHPAEEVYITAQTIDEFPQIIKDHEFNLKHSPVKPIGQLDT